MPERVIIHTPAEIEKIRRAGAVTGEVRDAIAAAVRPGMTTFDLDQISGEIIRATGGRSAFLGYGDFPGNVCISVNDTVIHGIGSPKTIIENGDIVSIDVGVAIGGALGDCAVTVPVGEISASAKHLLDGTKKALFAGIDAARAGNPLRKVSAAVESVGRHYGLGIVRDYVGHGCGIQLHEPPEVPNFTGWGGGPVLQPGMVICIEPMFNLGGSAVKVDRRDGWTVRTRDGSLSAHFEHMILITEKEAEILTWQKTM
ncbi:MAG: type I methionyl aminopeptidase [Victivallaceae bacterium]|nr:type I methionyl aminopeptidase [Victivallaceae bacterium]